MSRIDIRNVTKRYGSVTALSDVSLSLEEGRIYGLLGRNGAGKTTLLNIITNRIFADSGDVALDGIPVRENDQAQGRIYMVGEQGYYPDGMRVSEVFRWTGEFYGGFDGEGALRLCERFKLDPRKKIRGLSTGYTTIYKVITALCVDAPFILLDEPVLGLDANHRELLYRVLLEHYAENPRCFVISTHLIEEVASVIEDVAIIAEGRIIENQSCEELLMSGYTASGPAAAVDAYATGRRVIGTDILGGLKSVCILEPIAEANPPAGIEITKLNLQKLFIRLTEE